MKPHKYKAKRTECRQEHTHASKAEAIRCNELALLQRSGAVLNYDSQPKRVNISGDAREPIWYTPDFYVSAIGEAEWYEEVKGKATDKRPDWKMKQKLWRLHGPCPLIVYHAQYSPPKSRKVRTIEPQRRAAAGG